MAQKIPPVTPELIERVEARLRAARTKMLFNKNWGFFAYLAMHLKPMPVEGLGTCATDGDHFLYDPAVLDSETVEWLEFSWGHEVLHLFGMDLSRKPKDDILVTLGPDQPPVPLWNVACDIWNNLKLEEEGFVVPPFVPIDRSFRGKSKDEIYADLKKKAKSGKGTLPKGRLCGGCVSKPKQGQQDKQGQGFDAKALTEWTPTQQDIDRWKALAKEALEAAKQRGQCPGFAQAAISKLLAAKQDWRSILWQFCTRSSREWRYVPPSRTGAARNLILPRTVPGDCIEHIVIVVDTSGSISDHDVEEFGAEITAICTTIRCRVTVLMCDAAVHEVYDFGEGEFDWKALSFTGRGGTDFRPAFRKVEEMGMTPTCLVYFTDLEGTFPDGEPSYPVLWANTSARSTPPWGQHISLRDETV